MATRTCVTVRATRGVSDDEARAALNPLLEGRPFGPIEVWRSGAAGQPVTLFVSLDGDVEEQVLRKLSGTNLAFEVDAVEQLELPEWSAAGVVGWPGPSGDGQAAGQ